MNTTNPFGRLAALSLSVFFLLGTESAHADLDSACILRLAASADGEMTLAEMRQQCQADTTATVTASEDTGVTPADEEDERLAVVSERLAVDKRSLARPFTLMAYKPTYFLPLAYNDKVWNEQPFRDTFNVPEYENEDIEAQFQISLKVPLAIDLFGDRMDLYFGYTNRSFWQVYNDEDYDPGETSRPFRETNHEPEVWAQFLNDWTIFGFTNTVNKIGFNHQSNGRGGDLSRSWNRIFADFIFEKGPWAIGIRPWTRISEDREDDDNPDITDYLGHGELRIAYQHEGHVFSMMTRNQIESGFDEGAVELGWSFPIGDYPFLKGYVQYFYGYGESMIDYDNKVNRIGIGISLTDWLD
jgi:phospholipase A1